MGSKSSPPPTPDYKGAAEATAAGSRVNQYTPWGSLTYSPQGTDATGNQTWGQTLSLSPDQQKLLDTQNQTSLGLSGLQSQGLGAVQNLFGNLPSQGQLGQLPKGLDPSSLGAMPSSQYNLPNLPNQVLNQGQTGQDAILARVMPQLNQFRDRQQNQLANQGIPLGSKAYDTAQRQIGQQENDAVSQAALQGIGIDQSNYNQALQTRGQMAQEQSNQFSQGLQGRQQGLGEQQAQYQQGLQGRNQAINEQGLYSQLPINLLNAIRTGSQVQNPTFGQTPAGPNYLGAAQLGGQYDMNAYNAGVGANNSLLGGLFSLGGAALMAPKGTFFPNSDIRLKSNIVKVGDHPKGFGVYEYDIDGRRERGVIAQEVEKVMPHVVHEDDRGYKTVDYGAING